ncbi:cysteine desulfurase [Amylibacter marinus]|uniref:Cysteine desulfurase n=1 Tax=Amylibacter marinus TaxID=1475483 RepID=A0ABQ5VVJ5_9RHOB|nr:urate hydroxylase PuuD [Amylibacter marinus]GLQ35207.1 cysteine desulfurase [Amylibacter marinus]
MFDLAVVMAWMELAARWVHVITAIAWIGSSFYFIALDLGLRKREGLPHGVHGEEWQVHGGGFYHIQKYLVAPDALPEHLTWFKWESYATWMSGFALMILLYYAGADLYLIDPRVADISTPLAILISIGSMAGVWLVYNWICNSGFGADNRRLMVFLYLALVALAWGFTQVFSGRAALLHLGAVTATIMAANVFMVIIPNQKIVVADLIAGRKPDPKYGKIAKQRSTHNNYLTLPVLFLMLSNHYPLAFASEYNWIIASLVFLIGVCIRHYFNSLHARNGNPHWTWAAAGILFFILIWLSLLPAQLRETTQLTKTQQKYMSATGFQQVHDIVLGRCSMCHATEPVYEGVLWAPKGVVLDNPTEIAGHARAIYLQAGISHAMPPANLSFMEPAERLVIANWFRSVGYF